MTDRVNATYNGKPIAAAEGVTVGAALMANGVHAWRSTRHNSQSRGLFCGIGVCFDCLVEIDGEPNQRACMVRLSEDMDISGADTGEERK
jgi:predicted molibdopterin-dependent oxidoreductase YjgC